MNLEWPIENGYASAGKFKKFASQYPREYASLFANLDKVWASFEKGQDGEFSDSVFPLGRDGRV